MDQQGFAPQGLAPPRAAPSRRVPTRGDMGKSAIYTGSSVVHDKPDAEARTIGFFRGIQQTTGFLWFAQFIAMLPVAGLAWLFTAMGWKSGGFALKRWVQAPMNALFKTSVAEVTQFPANSARSAADMARESKHPQVNARAAELDGKVAAWETRGQGWRKSTANFFKGIRESVGKWFDGLTKDSWIAKRLKGFTEWRINRHTPKADKAIDAAHAQVEGIVKGPETLQEAATKAGKTLEEAELAAARKSQGLFKPVFDLLDQAKKAGTPAERAALLKKAEETAAGVAKGLTGKEAKAAHEVRDIIGAAGKSTRTLLGHMEALGAGARGQMKNLLRIGGRIPLFYAIVGAGVAAGAVAAGINAKRDHRLARKALEDMKSDIGDPNHPIIKQAEKLEQKAGGRRWVGAGLSTVADGAYLAPMNSMLGFAAVMGASQLGQVGQLIMPDNRSLNAYTMLKRAEMGKVNLDPKQRIELVQHLVTAVPAIEQQGGVHNRLSLPVAQEIVKRNMSVRDTMRFLSTPDQFMEVVKKVAAEQKTADEAAAAEKAAAEKAAGAKAPAVAAPIADKPSMKIAAAKGTSQGRVVEREHAVGQG